MSLIGNSLRFGVTPKRLTCIFFSAGGKKTDYTAVNNSRGGSGTFMRNFSEKIIS